MSQSLQDGKAAEDAWKNDPRQRQVWVSLINLSYFRLNYREKRASYISVPT